ncbi:hypothetical protein SODALDRAFT_65686 [Sodiomyces alkalinus F11]|uniref:C2H2-type domain-containing protein n=1 Tax=Sodiomyces alkalinus (strain CBS 110278 / VKM F-3762 / F11) TaxID=1314773 RepID=A0A3N2PLM7_SODAK|nr:hypothetical protein SODALDRAFT_65686 [Sodiomyces alkalinus F11]ROT35422.1 hypothetical protein SODALDRAFT_65686 [Sodiomyces alkalinus F11]
MHSIEGGRPTRSTTWPYRAESKDKSKEQLRYESFLKCQATTDSPTQPNRQVKESGSARLIRRSHSILFPSLSNCAPEFECNTCGRDFGSHQALNLHMDALDHGVDHECDDCSDIFSDEEDLRDHELSEHYYCDPCDKYFGGWNAINNHRNSNRHASDKVACLFCGKDYAAASGATHYVERGCCPKAPVDRMEFYEAVRKRDPTGILTKTLLTRPTGANHVGFYQSTKKCWNSEASVFECYFCHRRFKA